MVDMPCTMHYTGQEENEVVYLNQRLYYDTVVFDLDGTLLNSLEDLAASVNFALRANGFPGRTLDEVRRFIGNGGRLLIARALPEGCTDDDRERVYNDFSGYYKAHMRDFTRPYPGIPELLSTLADKGIGMAVVSNKMNSAVAPLVDFWFGEWIKVAVGEGEGIPKKPDPKGVRKALSLLGSAPQRAVYLGDSDVDIETARNAGLLPVGCTWGFRDRAVLVSAGAAHIIGQPGELPELL